MKLWTTVGIEKLPQILQNGLHPLGDEIQFSPNAERVADGALSLKGELAVLEIEISDGQLDELFVDCFASYSDDLVDAEGELEDALESGDTETATRIQEMIQVAESSAVSATQLLEHFGYVCLVRPLPPSMLKLLDPATMLEALHSGDAEVVAHAVETTDATAFKSLGANFWVWLMMLMSQIFGPGYGGFQEEEGEGEDAAEASEQIRAAVKKPRKKRPKRKKKASSA